MSTPIQEVEAGILNAVASAIQANAPLAEAYVASGEAAVQSILVNLFKNIPSVKGIAGLAVGPIESTIESAITSYVSAFIAKETPASVVALVVALLQAQAKAVAG